MNEYYHEKGIKPPKLGETPFLVKPQLGRISLFIHGPYDAVLLIIAKSQRKAYVLANTLRAIITCYHGIAPWETFNGFLLEFQIRPTPDMSREDLVLAIAPTFIRDKSARMALEIDLGSGSGLNYIQLTNACGFASVAISHLPILDALLHLEYSRNLVWGYMVGSFYESHYCRDRQKLTRYQLEGAYLENRFRYDSAFVSAFRGIECILGAPHFKRGQIATLLEKTDHTFGTSFSSTKYRSWHEIFSSRRKWWRYEDLISYYLKLRNAVSAHGNPSPPHIVMEDQVFEIQYLLQDMIADIVIQEENPCRVRGS